MPKTAQEIDRELAGLLLKRAELQEQAAALLEQVVALSKQIESLESQRPKPLRARVKRVDSVNMEPAHRGAISRARLGPRWGEFHELRQRKGYQTLSALARAALMSPQALSQAMAEPSSKYFRAMKPERAQRIEKLIGWPAKNWPSAG